MADYTLQIESVKPIQTQPLNIQISGKLPALKKGEVLQAVVVTQNGENLTLKTTDGKLINAKVVGDLMFNGGDNIELIVQQKNAGQLIMHIVSLEHQKPALPLPNVLETMGLLESKEAKDVLNLLKNIQLKPTEERIANAMQILQENPELDTKAAVFFTANEIPVTEENKEAYQKLVLDTQNIGAKLIDLALELSAQEDAGVTFSVKPDDDAAGTRLPDGNETILKPPTEENNTAVKMQVNLNTQEDGARPAIQNAQEDSAKPAIENLQKDGIKPAIPTEQAPDDTVIKNAVPRQDTVAPQIRENSKMQYSAVIPQDTAEKEPNNMPAFAVPQDTVKDAVKTGQPIKAVIPDLQEISGEITDLPAQAKIPEKQPVTYTAKDITAKILSTFMHMDKKESETAQNIQKTGTELLAKLDDLKMMIKEADIRDKAGFTAKVDDLYTQVKLSSDINRYICMHIPIQQQNRERTAELYIYKRNKRGQKIDPANTVIQIGLNTENMGRVETTIRVDRKNISLVFKMQDEDKMQNVKNKSYLLYKDLKEIGYTLTDTQVQKLFQKTTIANAEEELLSAEQKPTVFLDYRV